MVNLINLFGEHFSAGESDTEEMAALLDRLDTYAQFHFADEEALMTRIGIDARHVASHQAIHREFLRDITTIRQEVAGSQANDPETLHNYLVYWLAYHILGIDQSMARQAHAVEGGGDPVAAYEAELERDAGAVQPLVDAVVGLVSVVRTRNEELAALNRSLEERVRQRTEELTELTERLKALAMTDQLCNLPNRRRAMQFLEDLWISSQPLSCIMVDVDHFKDVNDTYGHEAGDRLLQRIARELTACFRNDDLVARLGGDEFLIVCPHTSLPEAIVLAQKLHERFVSLLILLGDGQWQGSLSIGVAVRDALTATPVELLKVADSGLYAAKHAGRNCVRFVQFAKETERHSLSLR